MVQITETPIGQLRPYDRNPRKISEDAINAVAGSIAQFGFKQPIIVDADNVIIAGHTRLAAAKRLGLATVPVVIADDLTPEQAKAYRLADNRVAEFSEWDADLLKVELDEIELDLDYAQFDELLHEMGEESDAPQESEDGQNIEAPPEQEAVSKRGEIYELGPHRLMCGDSTSAEDWAALMGGETGDTCVTDPPYGLGKTDSVKNNYDQYDDTERGLSVLVEKTFPIMQKISKSQIITPGNKNQRMWPQPTWTMAWFTPAGVGCGPWGFCCWQPILCYGKDPKLSSGKGSHPDAIVHTEGASSSEHPCAKPIKFWSWLLNRVSKENAVIIEPFAGSGTTIIACAMTNRICRAMELSPSYCDVIRKRWTKFAKENDLEPGSGALE